MGSKTKAVVAAVNIRLTEDCREALEVELSRLSGQAPGIQFTLTDAARSLIMKGAAVSDAHAQQQKRKIG